MRALPKTAKRLLIGFPVALFAIGLLWLVLGPLDVYHSEPGRWQPHDDFEAAQFKIFDQIAEQQPHDIKHGQNLRFMFAWPQRKWVTFAQRSDGGAEVVVAESMMTPDGKTQDKLEVRTFGLAPAEYRAFLTKFDEAAAGYRFQFVMGWDGLGFFYERWKNGSASHYVGNASFVRKDHEVLYAVVDIVRRNTGFAGDNFQPNPKFRY